jgi:hypothetical protein
MNTYNLEQVVDFPTRIFKEKVSQLDNIFLDRTELQCISVYPIQNGLSDHEAQFLILDRIPISSQTALHKHKIRQINDETLANFQALLKKDTGETVYSARNVNNMFNKFHCTFLRYYEKSLPLVYRNHTENKNNWITKGIQISCRNKRDLYIK